MMTSEPSHTKPDESPVPVDPAAPRGRVREVAMLFTRLGFTAFGGPVVHVAMMEEEVVNRRAWIDRQHFLDMLAAVNFVPGPNSTEMAIHLGHVRAGWKGLLTAGACFICPAVLIILPIAWGYVTYGTLPQVQQLFHRLTACVVAFIAAAGWRFARASMKDPFTIGIAIGATAAAVVAEWRFPSFQPEIPILAASALLGAIWYAPRAGRRGISMFSLAMLTPAWWNGDMLRLLLFFLKVGATLFGSGYVLISYLQSGLVDDFHWLTYQQMRDAIAVGQVTPGPLLTTATFIGYVVAARTFNLGVGGGIAGGLIATIGIFLPSFCFVALLGPALQRIRRNAYARGALDGMNAAVVALLLVVAVRFAAGTMITGDRRIDWINLLITAGALVAVMRWKVNSTWLLLIAAAIGLLLR